MARKALERINHQESKSMRAGNHPDYDPLPKGGFIDKRTNQLVQLIRVPGGKEIVNRAPQVYHATVLNENTIDILKNGLRDNELLATSSDFPMEWANGFLTTHQSARLSEDVLHGLGQNPLMFITGHPNKEHEFTQGERNESNPGRGNWPATKGRLK
ncbi:MAG: hypothetical protein GOV15_00040, partial [Candidatus Diapherotrites archaeon]|nr:hypothetical protein [Candidatus Diapherotrites archaeon]